MKWVLQTLIVWCFLKPNPKPKVELVRADELEGATINSKRVRILRHEVSLRYYGKLMTCDSVYYCIDDSTNELFGNVILSENSEPRIRTSYMKIDERDGLGWFKQILKEDSKGKKNEVLLKYDFRTGRIE